ncbi:MAG TPA: amidase [Planctomycetaceae bacterium]|nr:amidase [Planctomycetaceae bacterium]
MPTEPIWQMTAVAISSAVRSGEISAVEVTEAILDRIETVDPQLNAFCISMADSARATALSIDEQVSRGEDPGRLAGVPISIKDNLYIEGERTTFGSKWFEDNVTSEDTPLVARLKEAGAVLIGRTNSPEFGWKGATDNLVFGTTRNPWNTDRTPGGSSGGASAAVAAGMGPVGIGTDGGGSIRIPAAFCGLFGIKASFGRVPNYPATTVDSLRHKGPLTRTVGDAALVLDVIAGPDDRDSLSLPADTISYSEVLEEGISGWKIAYSPDMGFGEVDPEVASLCAAAAERFSETGATVDTVSLDWPDPYECWNIYFYGGIAGSLGPRLAAEGDQLDPGLKALVDEGVKLSGGEFARAALDRFAYWQQVVALYEDYDLLVTPGTAVPPFPVGLDNAAPMPGQEARPLLWTPFTYPFNLTGQPASVIPCGFTDDGLPVSLQVVGRRYDDAGVLRASRAYERIAGWSDRWPELATAVESP